MLVSEKARELKVLRKVLEHERRFYLNVSNKPMDLSKILELEKLWQNLENDSHTPEEEKIVEEVSTLFQEVKRRDITENEFFEKLQRYLHKILWSIMNKQMKCEELQKELEEVYSEHLKNNQEFGFIFANDRIKDLIISFLLSEC